MAHERSGDVGREKTADPGREAPPVAELVARSGDLKAELVDFAMGPRFLKASTVALKAAAARSGGYLDDDGATLAIDHFTLQHRLPDGRTVVERFVAGHRPPLSDVEREMVLGWREVVESAFEVVRHDGDGVILHNLIDDLEYRTFSNMGRAPFEQLDAGDFVITRIVPVHPAADAWLISGSLAVYPADDAVEVAHIALEVATASPGLIRRNPELLRRAWEMQAEARADFIEFFGTDLVVLPPAKAQDGLRDYHRHRQEKLQASLPDAPSQSPEADPIDPDELGTLPPDVLAAESVALLYDEAEGLCYLREFGRVDALFAEPTSTRDHTRIALLREYLADETTPPVVIRRLVERHPDGADPVFRVLLRKPGFTWEQDGEALLRSRKESWFRTEPTPTIAIVGDRLVELLAGE